MDLINKIKSYINSNNLLEPNSKILVGLSGGPDSVFLIHILKSLQQEYKINLIAAHLDHQWRLDSYKDVDFCIQLCLKLSIPLITAQASQITLKKKTKSLEEKGRLLRRAFFDKIAQEQECKAIALAHHLDDQQETFFIRLIRGSTISGLVGIKPKNGIYIRPLLSIFKQEILTYLNHSKINYLTDETNNSIDFLRNRIRKEVIPALRHCDSRFDYNFNKTISHITQTEDFLCRLTEEHFHNISYKRENKVYLNIEKFLETDLFLQKRILIIWLCSYTINFNLSESLLKEITRFFKNTQSKEHSLSINWKIIKNKNKAAILLI